jgi:Cap4 dsDNA endonuclease
MSIRTQLLATGPREVSGPRTANRFDFQKDWALCEILARHLADTNDYCVILEFHDDVLVLDSSQNPGRADFFQIKTKRGKHWTLSELLEREKGDGGEGSLSYLRKLYVNRLVVPVGEITLNFVSNASFNVPLAGTNLGP